MKKKFKDIPVLIFAALVTISVCYCFVMWMTHTNHPGWHLQCTGEIGDTVGGLTAPVIGILNTILLICTLLRQHQQINQQELNRHEDNLNALIDRKVD